MTSSDGEKPWFRQRLRAFHDRTDQRAQERHIAESFQEHPQDRITHEQCEQYDNELRYRAQDKWWANREERQYIKEIKMFPPEVRDRLIADLIKKRMAILEEKDRQAYLKRIMVDPNPKRTMRERFGDMVRGEPEQER